MNQNYIKSLSDPELIQSTERIVETERKIVQALIWHLQEIQDRKLYISMGHDSLYKCLIVQFKMSDTTAYGRIKVLKILDEVPEISDSLKTGALSISNIALAHSFIEKHEKTTGQMLSSEDKTVLIENIKNKTTTEAKEFFARCNPETALPHDEIRPITEAYVQIRSTVKNELLEKINYLKSLVSHEHTNPTHEELLTLAFDALIEQVEKKKGLHTKSVAKSARESAQKTVVKAKLPKASTQIAVVKAEPPEQSTQSFTDGNSRYVPRKVKRYVLERSRNQCEHVHVSGERCTSRFQLQFDHINAFSKGGKATLDNMQLLCRVHNAFKLDH